MSQGVVSYRNSTSNHNWKSSIVFSSLLYLIEILHQTTTCQEQHKEQQALYLIEILHQTTTFGVCSPASRRCILSKFYIKPQLRRKCPNFCCRCILSKFYIKPQPWSIKVTPTIVVSYRNSTSNHNNGEVTIHVRQVVSYRNSTSNHNSSEPAVPAWMLYLIEILHQTTTRHLGCRGRRGLYLIEILHQTTTRPSTFRLTQTLYLIEILHQTTTLPSIVVCCRRCILSKFYIKPQRRRCSKYFPAVVSYRNSTSNHNSESRLPQTLCVVSYRNSTSNHNSSEPAVPAWMLYLIEILHQTTTRHLGCRGRRGLYLIEILHQTTTRPSTFRLTQTLYLIEILHQTTTLPSIVVCCRRCILSKFYIKPQPVLPDET